MRRSAGGVTVVRRLVPIAAVLLALAISLGVVGCGGDEQTTTTVSTGPSDSGGQTTTTSPSPTTSVTASSTTDTSGTTTTEQLSSAETLLPNGYIRAMGFIDKVWESGGKRHIRIDYAEFLTGQKAEAAAIEDGYLRPDEGGLPNDYYIRNRNTQKREFTVSPAATFQTATYGGGMERRIGWAEFKSFWGSPPEGAQHMSAMPWWIERVGTEILSIEEQYLP